MTEFAVFVKPWKALALPELAAHIKQLGFDLIELPVRPGFASRENGRLRRLDPDPRDLGQVTAKLPPFTSFKATSTIFSPSLVVMKWICFSV